MYANKRESDLSWFGLARGTVGASHLHSRKKGERAPPRRDTADVSVFVRCACALCMQCALAHAHIDRRMRTAAPIIVDLIMLNRFITSFTPPAGSPPPRGFSLIFSLGHKDHIDCAAVTRS
jgi:hypothetical protein